MKYFKMLGLVATMVVAVVAGTSTASATALFTDSSLTTPYPAGTTIKMSLSSGSSSIFTGSGGEALMTCTESAIAGKTSNETGATVTASIESLTWGKCNTTLDTISNGSLAIERIGANEAKVSGTGSQWTSNTFGVSCTYGTGTGTTLGTITGGSEPILHINAVGLTKTAGGFLCPSTAGWDAQYTFTEPHSIFIGSESKGGSTFYTNSSKTTRYSSGTVVDLSLKSGATAKFTSGSETIVSCTGATAKGKTSNETGETVISNLETLTWSGCSQTTDTVTSGKLEVKWTSGSNGEVVGKESQWTLGVFGTSCSYGLGEGVKLGTLTGGETPTLNIAASIPRTAGGALCPSAVTWDAEYVVTEPHALYVGA